MGGLRLSLNNMSNLRQELSRPPFNLDERVSWIGLGLVTRGVIRTEKEKSTKHPGLDKSCLCQAQSKMLSTKHCSRLFSPLVQLIHHVHTSPQLSVTFYEKDPKYGYGKFDPNKKLTIKEKIHMYKEGIQDLKLEVKMWKDEVQDKLYMDPVGDVYPNETKVIWKFNESTLDDWIVTTDSDHNEGLSNASLAVSTLGHGMFSGTLNTHVPQDGVMKRSGYCNIKSKRLKKSFQRDTTYEWPMYNHLVIRCRGDGRSYMLNLHTPGDFDIPFSKFFLQSKGRIQDIQNPLDTDRISSIGLSLVDQNNGPFQLELDYIGIEYDPNHTEEFAYEMYLFENEVRGIVNW
ncbi:hypothetical protein M8J76_004691 [Diaphorina citri]|nr:hypothetical protein M8J76_004691 [Diaphorina citri]